MKKLIYSSIICLIISTPTFAQQTEDAQKNALRKLSWLIGEWSGTSEVNMGGKKSTVFVKESVRPSLDSTIFIINGRGTEKDSLTNLDKIVHDAFAVVSFDESKNKYRWNAWRIPGGTYGELEIKIGINSFEWMTIVQGGQTRYKAILNEKGQWIEIGEFSKDGVKWYKFITMTLNKLS